MINHLTAKTTSEMAKAYQPKAIGEWHYERQLWQARMSPDGKTLFGAGYDSTVQRWSLDGAKEKALTPLKSHDGWVQAIAVHPTRPLLYSADSWGKICCWQYDAESAKPVWEIAAAHPNWIRDLAVSRDGKWLASGGDRGVVKLWDSQKGTPKRTFDHHADNVLCLMFHPAEDVLVTGDLKGKVRAVQTETGKLARTFDASWLFQRHRIQDCGGVRCLAASADGKHLLCGGQKTPVGAFANGTPGVVLFDWKNGEKKQEMAIGGNGDGFVYDLQFHPDGFVAGVSCAFPGKGHLWFWRPGDKKPFVLDSKLANGRSIAWQADGKRCVLLCSDSPNANGRPLKGGKYVGGRAKLRILELGSHDSSGK